MAAINRTYYKESDACTTFLFCLLLLFFSASNLSLTSAQELEWQASEEALAYVSPFAHDTDGFKEVYFESGMETTLEEKTNLILPDIFFAYGDAEILPQSEVVLQELVHLLRVNSDLAIELSAHTDSRGNARFNERLSRNRARNLVKYLTQHGIEADRLIAMGQGEEILRNHCGNGISCSEQEHQENRRIEMRTAKIVGRLPLREDYIYKY